MLDAVWLSMLLSASAGMLAVSVVAATFYFIRWASALDAASKAVRRSTITCFQVGVSAQKQHSRWASTLAALQRNLLRMV